MLEKILDYNLFNLQYSFAYDESFNKKALPLVRPQAVAIGEAAPHLSGSSLEGAAGVEGRLLRHDLVGRPSRLGGPQAAGHEGHQAPQGHPGEGGAAADEKRAGAPPSLRGLVERLSHAGQCQVRPQGLHAQGRIGGADGSQEGMGHGHTILGEIGSIPRELSSQGLRGGADMCN